MVATGFSLSWLFLANLVGLLLAALLVWPSLNDVLAPYTYGRWVPLHMDWHLYGWCSLPLLGLAFKHFLDSDDAGIVWSVVSYSFWSIALIIAGISWLMGEATGKLFLNWRGSAGAVFGGALMALWAVLAMGLWRRFSIRSNSGESKASFAIKTTCLVSLLAIPAVLLFTSDPAVYPPVNPDSGGATGHSLLASSLGIVFLMGLLPGIVLKLAVKDRKQKRQAERVFWGAFLASVVLYLSIEHGNASNHSWNQIWGLASLLVWPPLVWHLWRAFQWSEASKLWRVAFFFWWAFLTIDGWLLFLPGILNTLKFTNALVAHSHLAMAGMVTALNMVILIELGGSRRLKVLLARAWPFWLWNVCCLAYVLIMTVQGWREGVEPGVLFGKDYTTSLNYSARLVVGGGMALSSGCWVGNCIWSLMSVSWNRITEKNESQWRLNSVEGREAVRGV